jgi:hypothetical protein
MTGGFPHPSLFGVEKSQWIYANSTLAGEKSVQHRFRVPFCHALIPLLYFCVLDWVNIELIGEDHVWFEDRWMVTSLCDE